MKRVAQLPELYSQNQNFILLASYQKKCSTAGLAVGLHASAISLNPCHNYGGCIYGVANKTAYSHPHCISLQGKPDVDKGLSSANILLDGFGEAASIYISKQTCTRLSWQMKVTSQSVQIRADSIARLRDEINCILQHLDNF